MDGYVAMLFLAVMISLSLCNINVKGPAFFGIVLGPSNRMRGMDWSERVPDVLFATNE